MKITLLHPSRKRPIKAKLTLAFWIAQWSGKTPIEYILSLDKDDVEGHHYSLLNFNNPLIETHKIVNNNSSVVEATNKAAKFSTGDILIYMSDDFNCHKNWDLLLIEIIKDFKEQPVLVKVDDCLQKFDVAVLTIPIMNRQLYEKLGYFWHPEYKSMFVDEDLYWTCKNNNWLIESPHLQFPHAHHTITAGVENDETYQRSALNWNSGKETFAKRKSLNFPL